MTRGTLILIDKNGKIFISSEFNGDMYLGGKGDYAVEALKCVETKEEFLEAVTKFNNNCYAYRDEQLVFNTNLSLEFQKETYYKKWSSDYLYIKNASSTDISAIDYDNTTLIIAKDAVTVLKIGKLKKVF